MKPLYTQNEFDLAKSMDKLPCQCLECSNTFYKEKRVIKRAFKGYDRNNGNYCSRSCVILSKNKNVDVICTQCGISFNKTLSQYNRTKNHFCSRSCAATYNNTHKTKGTRISKLEIWLKEQLTILYPNLKISYNNKEIINSELDIYIPKLKLAFELNGIFHYEPIFGEKKLNQTQNNDQRKFQACLEHNIELCIIDTSQQKYFKEKTSKKYLEIITNIINTRPHSLVR